MPFKSRKNVFHYEHGTVQTKEDNFPTSRTLQAGLADTRMSRKISKSWGPEGSDVRGQYNGEMLSS